jgi:hypothetical protein
MWCKICEHRKAIVVITLPFSLDIPSAEFGLCGLCIEAIMAYAQQSVQRTACTCREIEGILYVKSDCKQHGFLSRRR